MKFFQKHCAMRRGISTTVHTYAQPDSNTALKLKKENFCIFILSRCGKNSVCVGLFHGASGRSHFGAVH